MNPKSRMGLRPWRVAAGAVCVWSFAVACTSETPDEAYDPGDARAVAPGTSPIAEPVEEPDTAPGTGDELADPGFEPVDDGEPWRTIWSAPAAGSPVAGLATLDSVEVSTREGSDRITFIFESGLPPMEMEYIDRPVRECSSGRTVPLPGDGWLAIRFHQARSHTDAGAPTVDARAVRDAATNLPSDLVLELVRICDFEGEVAWVAAVSSPNRFRVLREPGAGRVSIDVRH